MRRLLLVVALVGAVAVAPARAGNDPKALVATLSDMPPGFRLVGSNYTTLQQAAASSPISAARFRSWGYLIAYEVEFQTTSRSIAAPFTGPFQVDSIASVYTSAAGARASLAGSARQC